MVWAAFMLEVQVRSLKGNVAAGSTAMGFVITPDAWACYKKNSKHILDYQGWEPGYQGGHGSILNNKQGNDKSGFHVQEDQNEAVGCLTGFFFKRPHHIGRGICARVRNAVAWKNAHMGPSFPAGLPFVSRPARASTLNATGQSRVTLSLR